MATYHPKKDLYEARRRVNGQRKSFYAPTEEEAERKADEYSQVPTLPLSNQPTLREYAHSAYVPTVQNHSLKWRQQIAWALDSHILPALGNQPLESLDRTRIQTFLGSKLRVLSRSSTGHLRKVLHAILELAEVDDLIKRNPVPHVKLPPMRTKEQETILTIEQVALAWKNAQSPELKNAIFLGMLGLRKGEVLGMHWNNVGVETLFVETQYDGEPLKNQSAQRQIPLPDYANIISWDNCTISNTACGSLDSRTLNGYYTYTNKKGKKIPARGFKAALAKAGLPDVTFHSLRKTCATTLLEIGCPVELRDAILGHSSGHVRDRYNRANVEQMRGYMGMLIERFENALKEVVAI